MKDYNIQIYGTWGLGPKVWAEADVGDGMSMCAPRSIHLLLHCCTVTARQAETQ